MRVLITGGAGRLGITVCKACLHDGFQVRAFDLDTPVNQKSVKRLNGKAEVMWGDITRPDSVQKALKGVNAVVHMAGILPPVAYEKPELAYRVNVGGTRIIVEHLKKMDTPIPFIL